MILKVQNCALLIFLFSMIPSTCHGQGFGDRIGKLSSKELLKYQQCNSDDECITVTNGLCDCANGGEEVAINANHSDSFNEIFGDKMGVCTLMIRAIPCGIGAGNTCENNVCRFNACANETRAIECLSTQNNTNATKSCMIEACQKPPEYVVYPSTMSESVEAPPEDEEILQDYFSQYNLESGKLLGEELKAFQSCETHDDCIYINNGFCDCANGGEEIAVNKNKYDDFNIIFNTTMRPCTKRGRPLPCGVGSGVRCNRRTKLCDFNPCFDEENAMKCSGSNEEGDILECMQEACSRRKFLRVFGN